MEKKTLLWIGLFIAAASIGLLLFEGFSSSHSKHNDAEHDHASEPDHHDSHQHDHQHGETEQSRHYGLVSPIPEHPTFDRTQAKIGWVLFRDPNLSSNKKVSCESCHNLRTNGAETTAVSTGVEGLGTRNSPTVFNASLNYRFFWDGRVNSLHDQLDGPIHDPVEMDSNWSKITEYVSQSLIYQQYFLQAELPITEHNIKTALVEFMNALNTPNSPFDQYLAGNENALSPEAELGWQTFQKEGCIRCHQGSNIGGGMVMRFGYFGQSTTGENRSSDKGRFNTTQDENDLYLFRVASLRNVALTPPYFHDGKTQHLSEAIKIMGESQLGKTFDDETIAHLEAFLNSLSGDRPAILQEFENE
ncbi:cytochrome B6 [Vibrio coralliilyticus]|uniref:Cytochrome B6 n=1 Tax=Vibrio coralliilyticus TaxID=190893 RepID=A0A837GCN0_9VIBR|nr:cytochrome c peroxidase [Vibrio coralliilyticus]KJY70675.1 cytochrome B6 [Vibrio coralliilyticus]QOU31343.1 c-type cytochrome [Vibrio coralliilyticus]